MIVGIAVFIALAMINSTLEQIRNHLAKLDGISGEVYRIARKLEGREP